MYISPCCQGCGDSGGGDRSSGEQRSISTGETNSGSLSSHGGELSQTNVHCPNKCSEKQVALSELIVVIDERTDRVHFL